MILFTYPEQTARAAALRFVKVLSIVLIFFASPQLGAQDAFIANNSNYIIANKFEVVAYSVGTFDEEQAFLKLYNGMNQMSQDYSRGMKYRYYWLISVDLKRKGLALEESLLKNLNRVGKEYGVSKSQLQRLYRNTVEMFNSKSVGL
ncbi:MAG: hypothetical protein AAF573_17035 [Bacteroidota bacterium]